MNLDKLQRRMYLFLVVIGVLMFFNCRKTEIANDTTKINSHGLSQQIPDGSEQQLNAIDRGDESLRSEQNDISDEQRKIAEARASLTERKVALESERIKLQQTGNILAAKDSRLRKEEAAIQTEQKELQAREKKLNEKVIALKNYRDKLRKARDEIYDLQKSVKSSQAEIEQSRAEIDNLKQSLESRADELDKKEAELNLQRQQLEKEKKAIVEKRQELQKWEEDLRLRERALLKKGGKSDPSRISQVQPLTPGSRVEALDTTKDGFEDTWLKYNDRGKIISEEFLLSAIDPDAKGGKITVSYETNAPECPSSLEGDTDGNGKIDLRAYYESCREIRRELDTNADGNMDQWVYYAYQNNAQCFKSIEKDLTFNGTLNYKKTFLNCEPQTEEWDMNENKTYEVIRSLRVGNQWIRRQGYDAKMKADDHYSKKEKEQAEEWYLRSIQEFQVEWKNLDEKVNSSVADAYIRLGNLYYAEDPESARSYYSSALNFGSNEQKNLAAVNIANSFFNNKEFSEARKNFALAIQFLPADTRSLRNYIDSTLYENTPEARTEATGFMQNFISRIESEKLNAKVKANAHWLFGVLHSDSGKFNPALAEFKSSLAADENNFETWNSLAYAQMALSQDNAALESVNRAYSIKNNDLNVLWNKALIEFVAGKKDKSEETLTQMLNINRKAVVKIYDSELSKIAQKIPARSSKILQYRTFLKSKLSVS